MTSRGIAFPWTVLRKAGIQWWSPWWPYPAIRHLGGLVRKSWRVLEFGSGASTPWLARLARDVVSLESDRDWYSRVKTRLKVVGYSNVDLRLRDSQDDYVTVDRYSQGGFDLVIVDGAWRDQCAHTSVRLVRPGGYIYLDNSDVPDPDHRSAVKTILRAAKTVKRFVGLSPGTVAVNQGLLIGVGS
jgi:predicted O-methyltransferase YrrM